MIIRLGSDGDNDNSDASSSSQGDLEREDAHHKNDDESPSVEYDARGVNHRLGGIMGRTVGAGGSGASYSNSMTN
jgi:hypothetical protein